MDDKRLRPGSAATSIQQDVLGRKAFVENLAGAIRTYGGTDSLTIGLYGPWGCGKSSLLNFVIEELKKDKETIAVARFNPWHFSQQDRLFSTFFATVSSLIKRNDDSEDANKIAAWLDSFAAATAPASLFRFGFMSEAAKQLSSAYDKFAAQWGDVELVKSEISEILSKSKKRYVIVIDDIDRLTDEEVRQIFQLVNSMADFQNVVYVLAFDHNMVAEALRQITGGQGHAYLDKVINVPITVPPLTTRQVRRLLIAELDVYAERQRTYDWNNKRLEKIIEVGIKNLSTIRQIERFTNALVVLEGLTKQDVDFTDHIALTMLKALEPSLYDFVGKHPELFVDDVFNQLRRAPHARDELEKAAVETALKTLTSLSHDDAVALLETVFPKTERLYERYGKSKEWGKRSWRIQSRACADYKTFSRYFVFRVDEGDSSAEDRDRLWESSDSVERFEQFIETIEDIERLHRTLEYIGDLDSGEVGEERISIIVAGVIDIGDKFSEVPSLADMFFRPFNKAIKSCGALLKTLPHDRCFAITMNALQRPPRSIEMPVTFVYRIGSPKSAIFTPEQAQQLSAVVAELLKAAWDNGKVVDHRRNLFLVTQWLALSGGAKNIIRESLSDDDAKFVKFLSLYENVRTAESYHPLRFHIKGIVGVYGLEELKARLQRLASDAQQQTEHERIAQILAEVEKGIQIELGEAAQDEDEDEVDSDVEIMHY
jgi:predicted KAP-like P-loop ATPase